jgi:ATP-dependent Clp protease ATP-binding subunit ClpC
VQLELDKVSLRLEEHAIVISITPEALEMLAEMGYDPEMGARPLRRVIQQNIEDTLSDSLLAGEFEDGDTIVIDVVDDEISLYKKEEKPIEEEEVLATG